MLNMMCKHLCMCAWAYAIGKKYVKLPWVWSSLFFYIDIPKPPGKIIPSRNTDTSVVVSWEESKDAKELVGYYIESSVVGSGTWEPCNNNPVKGSR